MKEMKRRAIVVEDDSLTAWLISTALERANFDVVTASNVSDAVQAIEDFDPDLALMDISLGDGPSGLDLAHIVRKKHPEIGVLILTKHPDPRSAGAGDEIPEGCGFLRKETVGDMKLLLDSISMVMANKSVSVRQDRDPDRPMAALSAKQIEILRMLAQGLTNSEIAARLGISNSAIEQRLTVVFKALGIADIQGVSPRAEAMRIFISNAGLPNRED